MSWHLKRSLWTVSATHPVSSFSKDDRERSSSISRRPFLRRPSTNGIILQSVSASTSNSISSLAVCLPDHPRITRARSRSSEALIPWKQPRRHSFSGSDPATLSPAPAINPPSNHALALFTTPRGRARGINTNPFGMEIPDLSLRSTFSPPYYKDQISSAPCMCKYTIYTLECGHPAEDHVDTRDCPHFQRTGVPCDRENPANRGRVSIKTQNRNGVCKNCMRRQLDKAELDAVTHDEERAKQQSLAEAKEREAAAKAHEERLFKESAEEYEMLRRKREQEDIEFMLQKSREEAAVREQKERDDLARALEESCRLGPADRNVRIDEEITTGQQEVEGGTLSWTRTDTTTTTETKRQHIPAPPPPPPAKAPVQLPTPPQTPIKAAPRREPPVEKPAAPVDFSAPASGVDTYGHYTIGGRRQPIHESQKQQAAKYLNSPSTPISPAPIVRLGSGVQPSSPSPRQMSVGSPAAVPVGDLRSGLRRTGGPRQSMPSRTASGEENELERHLARRRTWEPRDEISEPGSGRTSRAGSVVSEVSRPSTAQDQPAGKEIDDQRKKGWRKD